MEGRYNVYSQGSTGWTSMRNEEFQEEDMWGVLKERKGYTSRNGISRESSSNTFNSRRRPGAAAVRMIPRANNNPTPETIGIQHSAPVNIPDWSKIYGKYSKKGTKNVSWHDDDDDNDAGGDCVRRGSWDSDDEDQDNYDDDNLIPPHEWIAQKLARNHISSFSVCEGAGRTLKGRDLSRVRNAVLTKTGFLE